MSTELPTQSDVIAYFDRLSNWGRWGADDELGTLNHISSESRLRGAAAVRHGISVSCAWEVGTGEQGIARTSSAVPFAAQMPGAEFIPNAAFRDDGRWGFSGEHLAFTFHGGAHTHVDSLCHMFWDGQMYNGRAAGLVDAANGAAFGSVTPAADGMVTRGLLIDIPALRGVEWMEPGEPVLPEDLEAAEARQGVRVQPGDAILLRTGRDRFRRESGDIAADATDIKQPGWHAACLPWLHERQVAYIGSDVATDVMPSGYPGLYNPVHVFGLVAMGLWLIDNCDLTACAETAERLRQWDFNLSVAPLRLAGTSGSPANPIATF